MATQGSPAVPDANEDLVTVFSSDSENETQVVFGLLESAGIEVMTRNYDAPQDVLPGVGGMAILVRAEQAEEARRIIEENRSTTSAELEEAAEGTPSDEPTEPA